MRRRVLAAVAVWSWLAGLSGDTLQEQCDYIVGTGGSLSRVCEAE